MMKGICVYWQFVMTGMYSLLHKLSSRLISENQAVYAEDIDAKALIERKTRSKN